MMNGGKRRLERDLAETLESGQTERPDVAESARQRLPSETEIRVIAEADPVAEETKQYRKLAEEVDGRYDRIRADSEMNK